MEFDKDFLFRKKSRLESKKLDSSLDFIYIEQRHYIAFLFSIWYYSLHYNKDKENCCEDNRTKF